MVLVVSNSRSAPEVATSTKISTWTSTGVWSRRIRYASSSKWTGSSSERRDVTCFRVQQMRYPCGRGNQSYLESRRFGHRLRVDLERRIPFIQAGLWALEGGVIDSRLVRCPPRGV